MRDQQVTLGNSRYNKVVDYLSCASTSIIRGFETTKLRSILRKFFLVRPPSRIDLNIRVKGQKSMSKKILIKTTQTTVPNPKRQSGITNHNSEASRREKRNQSRLYLLSTHCSQYVHTLMRIRSQTRGTSTSNRTLCADRGLTKPTRLLPVIKLRQENDSP